MLTLGLIFLIGKGSFVDAKGWKYSGKILLNGKDEKFNDRRSIPEFRPN